MEKVTIIQTDEFMVAVEKFVENLITTANKKYEVHYIDNDEFVKLMRISKRTAQTWRDDRVIPFSQIGGKIYYDVRDIEHTIEKYRCPDFKDDCGINGKGKTKSIVNQKNRRS